MLECVSESITWFEENPHPDVVMMDVRLSDGLSFEIFEKVSIQCPVIFTTAYDEYAVRAFKYNSIDYLLKPVESKELQHAFQKLEQQQIPATHALEGLLNFIQPKEFRSRFLLAHKDGYKMLLVSEIAYFYSEFKQTRVKLFSDREEIVPHTLEELEQQLDPKSFFRVNRQFIVHIDAIDKVGNHFNGKLKLEIKNNPETEIFVSREKATLLKNWLDF
ncbi:Sensory transduction protein LytR [compost metagenome]